MVFSKTVRLSSFINKGLINCNRLSIVCRNEALLAVYRILFSWQIRNQNMTSIERVPKSNKTARAFAECSQNQPKFKKLGSPVSMLKRASDSTYSCEQHISSLVFMIIWFPGVCERAVFFIPQHALLNESSRNNCAPAMNTSTSYPGSSLPASKSIPLSLEG